MMTRRDRNLYSATAATLLVLTGLAGAAALSLSSSKPTSLADHRFSTANTSEHPAASPAKLDKRIPAQVESVTSATFEERVLRSSIPVVVDFYADWCGPCQLQGRILDDFAADSVGFKIVKVNVDQEAELAAQFQVDALPTLLVVRDGRVIARHVGVATKDQLKSALAN